MFWNVGVLLIAFFVHLTLALLIINKINKDSRSADVQGSYTGVQNSSCDLSGLKRL